MSLLQSRHTRRFRFFFLVRPITGVICGPSKSLIVSSNELRTETSFLLSRYCCRIRSFLSGESCSSRALRRDSMSSIVLLPGEGTELFPIRNKICGCQISWQLGRNPAIWNTFFDLANLAREFHGTHAKNLHLCHCCTRPCWNSHSPSPERHFLSHSKQKGVNEGENRRVISLAMDEGIIIRVDTRNR